MLVGIDLGTTFSLISAIGSGGTPTLFPAQNDPNRFLTPSVVHIGPRGALVGDLVEHLLDEEPGLPLRRFAKLAMGTDETVFTDHDGFAYRAETISALILKKLVKDAEAATGEAVDGAVITIPAHFNEAQRRATIDAARLADLPVRGLVEEPVAAATYFGQKTKAGERTLFVFDLGGGTLDATILQATSAGLFVLATEGSTNIGGKNFDDVIMGLVREQFRVQYRMDLDDDPEAMQTLRRFATTTKLALSEAGTGAIAKPVLLKGKPMRVSLTRAQFEAAAEPWLDAAEVVCQQALAAVNMAWTDIDELVLTGGSSLLPCVQRKLRDLSGLPAGRTTQDQPHAAVAYGAAILAEQLYGNKPTLAPPLKQTVTSNELGIRAIDPKLGKAVFHPLIGKNLPVPCSQRQTVYTRSDTQATVTLEVLQRKDAHSPPDILGTMAFGPLKQKGKDRPIDIELGFDQDGRVSLKATDPRSGQRLDQVLDAARDDTIAQQYQRLRNLPLKA